MALERRVVGGFFLQVAQGDACLAELIENPLGPCAMRARRKSSDVRHLGISRVVDDLRIVFEEWQAKKIVEVRRAIRFGDSQPLSIRVELWHGFNRPITRTVAVLAIDRAVPQPQ